LIKYLNCFFFLGVSSGGGRGGGRGHRGYRGRGRGRDRGGGDGDGRGSGRGHPSGLSGKDIGLWYAKRGKEKKKKLDIENVRSVFSIYFQSVFFPITGYKNNVYVTFQNKKGYFINKDL